MTRDLSTIVKAYDVRGLVPQELDAGGPHVAGGDDARRAGEAGEGGTEGAGGVGVELLRDESADVVGLDDGRQVAGHDLEP